MVGPLEALFCQLTEWKIFINSICHIKNNAAACRRLIVRPGWVLHKAGAGTYLVLQVSLGHICTVPITWRLGAGQKGLQHEFRPRSSWQILENKHYKLCEQNAEQAYPSVKVSTMQKAVQHGSHTQLQTHLDVLYLFQFALFSGAPHQHILRL